MSKVKRKELLEASMRAEEKAVSNRLPIYDRFERAEEALESTLKKSKTKDAPPRKRVIRDAFTLPEDDYEMISKLRLRAGKQGVLVTKSEVIRAGLRAMNEMGDEALKEVLEGVERLKTGRPGR